MGKIKKEDLESMKEVEEPKEQDMNPKDPTKKLKPLKAVLGVLALGALGSKAFDKARNKSNETKPEEMISKKPIKTLYQKATKQETAKMNVGGEVEILKGEEYIKDLL